MKKPLYYNWVLDDWLTYYAYETTVSRLKEITTRTRQKDGSHVAVIVPCNFEFKFMGYHFVSHPDPDCDENEKPKIHISELFSGFKLCDGFNEHDARTKARKILINVADRLKFQMRKAHGIIHANRWKTEYKLNWKHYSKNE
jgi:hypothetical protein